MHEVITIATFIFLIMFATAFVVKLSSLESQVGSVRNKCASIESDTRESKWRSFEIKAFIEHERQRKETKDVAGVRVDFDNGETRTYKEAVKYMPPTVSIHAGHVSSSAYGYTLVDVDGHEVAIIAYDRVQAIEKVFKDGGDAE